MLEEAIQPLLAPVVLISACGLMIMALSEKTQLAGSATPTQQLRFQGVGSQSTNLLCRLRLIRSALMCMLGCVALMLISSLLIGLNTTPVGPVAGKLAILVFVSGIVSMLTGAATFLLELRLSLREIAYEHERIMGLSLPGEGGGV